MNDQQLDPQEALALTSGARTRLAARNLVPRWYSPLGAVCIGAALASMMFPQPMYMVTLGLLAAGAAVHWYWTVKAGVTVNGLGRGRTAWVTLGMAVALIALSLIGFALRDAGFAWTPLVIGVITAVVMAALGRFWERVWIAELRAGR
jgi:hypothetical protein